MKILIPRINDATTRRDIREFANRIIDRRFRLPFTVRPKIISCHILSVSDAMGVKLRHGLLDVRPDNAAAKIIRKLNGAFLRGKRVGVKHYDKAVSRAIMRP